MSSTPQTVAEDQVKAQINPLLLRIGESGVGDDPRYGDHFIAVKAEIDRLANADYGEVVRLCERIITEEAKDLRVAGYYLLAKAFTEGLDGLLEGVDIYLNLVRLFGCECYPQRESARLQSIAWLNNDKILAFLNNINVSSENDVTTVLKLRNSIESLNKEIVVRYGTAVTVWTSLNTWIEKHLSNNVGVHAINSDKIKSDQAPGVDKKNNEISSELAFLRSANELYSYLATNRDWTRLVAMSRAMRWSSICLPQNEGGITKLPPPREAIIADVNREIEATDGQGRLAALEAYFTESGCQFYFDLQKHEVDVAKSLGKIGVVNLIEDQLRLLVRREPEIVRFSYSDGTPFASEKTRRWISKLGFNNDCERKNKPANSSLQDKVTNILKQTNEVRLSSIIDELDGLEVKDRSELFCLGMAKLDLCIRFNRYDVAFPLAEHLEREVEKYRLYEWDSTLALALWDRLLVVLAKQKSDEQFKQQRIAQLKGRICTTDLAYALNIF